MAKPSRWRRIGKRVAAGAGVFFVIVAIVGCITTDRFRSFGGSPSEATLIRMRASPRFVNGAWENAEPTSLMKVGYWQTTKNWWSGTEMREPICPLPIATDAAARLQRASVSGLRVTWLGHSTTLIEIDGHAVLTDPNWSERSSPSTIVGPRRFHPPPLAIADLPKIDAVVISHEHFDHLDMATVRLLAARGIVFHVPLAMGAHLSTFGVPDAQIVEHDWWEGTKIGDLEIVSTPSRHFNGRGAPWRPGALWTSWSLVGPVHRVFFSGDTGFTQAFREIAAREGPFDLALLEIGQYHLDWSDIHLGPNGALDAFELLGAKHLLPIHWGTFNLAYHSWSEPGEAIVVEAAKRGAALVMPKIGEPVEPTIAAPIETWWRDQPPMASKCP